MRGSKQDATTQAVTLLSGLRERVRGAPDPLDTAVRIAIAGDLGVPVGSVVLKALS
jgi:hypothetical protein